MIYKKMPFLLVVKMIINLILMIIFCFMAKVLIPGIMSNNPTRNIQHNLIFFLMKLIIF